MGLDLSGILNSIEIIANDAIGKAGYDKTIIGTIVDCINESGHIYKVEYQSSSFTAYAQDKSEYYKAGDTVYVTIPSNDTNLTRYIVGRTSQEIESIVIALGEELKDYSSLGDVQLDNHTLNKDKKELTEDSLSESEQELIKSGLYASPYFVIETNIENSLSFAKGNYGVEITLEFKDDVANRPFTQQYLFDINKMTGQPYNYITPAHQYFVFQVANGNKFEKIVSVKFFSKDIIWGEKDGGGASATKIEDYISFSNVKIYAASKIRERDSKYANIVTCESGNILSEKNTSVTFESQIQIGGTDFYSNSIAYYWFIEDLRVTEADTEKYLYLGGEGWRCLNKFNVYEIEDADKIAVLKLWDKGSKTLDITNELTGSYENVFKCVAVYNNIPITSNEIIVINSNYEKNHIELTCGLRSISGGDIEGPFPIKNTAVQVTDKAMVVCSEMDSVEIKHDYYWQFIDRYNYSRVEKLNGEKAYYQYIFGDTIDDHIDIKCGVIDKSNNTYLGTGRIRLTNVDQEMRERLVSKQNTFNALTGGGKNEGIYYTLVDDAGDKEEEIPANELDNYDPEKIRLYINASMIKTGSLTVGNKDGDVIFKADIDDPTNTIIGGFRVTNNSIFRKNSGDNSKQDSFDDFNNGVYVGTDGIYVGTGDSHFKVDKNGKISISNYATSSDVKTAISTSEGKINAKIEEVEEKTDKSISTINSQIEALPNKIMGQVEEKNYAPKTDKTTSQSFSYELYSDRFVLKNKTNNVEKEVLKATESGIIVDGRIEARSGSIGGFTIENNKLSSNGDNYIELDGTKTNPNFILAGGNSWDNAVFAVKKDGSIKATAGSIGGAEIKNGKLKVSSANIESVELGQIVSKGNLTITGDGSLDIKSNKISISSTNFTLTNAGSITAKDGAIGNWKIGTNQLSSGDGVTYVALNSNSGSYAIWAGDNTASDAPFSIQRDGSIYASKGIIAGLESSYLANSNTLDYTYTSMSLHDFITINNFISFGGFYSGGAYAEFNLGLPNNIINDSTFEIIYMNIYGDTNIIITENNIEYPVDGNKNKIKAYCVMNSTYNPGSVSSTIFLNLVYRVKGYQSNSLYTLKTIDNNFYILSDYLEKATDDNSLQSYCYIFELASNNFNINNINVTDSLRVGNLKLTSGITSTGFINNYLYFNQGAYFHSTSEQQWSCKAKLDYAQNFLSITIKDIQPPLNYRGPNELIDDVVFKIKYKDNYCKENEYKYINLIAKRSTVYATKKFSGGIKISYAAILTEDNKEVQELTFYLDNGPTNHIYMYGQDLSPSPNLAKARITTLGSSRPWDNGYFKYLHWKNDDDYQGDYLKTYMWVYEGAITSTDPWFSCSYDTHHISTVVGAVVTSRNTTGSLSGSHYDATWVVRINGNTVEVGKDGGVSDGGFYCLIVGY